MDKVNKINKDELLAAKKAAEKLEKAEAAAKKAAEKLEKAEAAANKAAEEFEKAGPAVKKAAEEFEKAGPAVKKAAEEFEKAETAKKAELEKAEAAKKAELEEAEAAKKAELEKAETAAKKAAAELKKAETAAKKATEKLEKAETAAKKAAEELEKAETAAKKAAEELEKAETAAKKAAAELEAEKEKIQDKAGSLVWIWSYLWPEYKAGEPGKAGESGEPDKANESDKVDDKMGRRNKRKLMDYRNESLIYFIFAMIAVIFCVQVKTLWDDPKYQIPPADLQTYQKPLTFQENQLDRFINDTTTFFKELSLAEIPAPATVTQRVDHCIKLAAKLERCKEYKNTGRVAAQHLRGLSDSLYEAGDTLREMFIESDSVHRTFNIEVKVMIEKFEGFFNKIISPDSNYFETRMEKLKVTIEDFGNIVDESIMAILAAQRQRENVYKALLDAKLETENYKIDNTKNDLFTESINEVNVSLKYLDDMAKGLKDIRGKLKNYELTMKKVKGNLGEVTHEALQHLKNAVEIWELNHRMFFEKQKTRTIED